MDHHIWWLACEVGEGFLASTTETKKCFQFLSYRIPNPDYLSENYMEPQKLCFLCINFEDERLQTLKLFHGAFPGHKMTSETEMIIIITI